MLKVGNLILLGDGLYIESRCWTFYLFIWDDVEHVGCWTLHMNEIVCIPFQIQLAKSGVTSQDCLVNPKA